LTCVRLDVWLWAARFYKTRALSKEAIGQGKVCVGFNWIAAIGGLLDPEQSQLGKTPEAIEKKLGFAALPSQDSDVVPLGGMGMHVSKYAPADDQAEALNFIKWFEQPEIQKMWAAASRPRKSSGPLRQSATSQLHSGPKIRERMRFTGSSQPKPGNRPSTVPASPVMPPLPAGRPGSASP